MMFRTQMMTALMLAFLALPVATAEQGQPAPDFSLPLMGGGEASLADFRGQVVMINFWASWCGPCREEMPHLEALYQRYEPMGFQLLAVNVEENSQDAINWLDDTPVSFPVMLDAANSVSQLYDVVAMPSTVVLDREGNLRHIHHGYKPGYEMEYQDQIRALIRE